MGRKSVAVLDVRSAEITALVAERGVNHTYLFKASKTEPYDGFDGEGNLFHGKKFYACCQNAVTAVEQICGERIRRLYVGVPGAFCTVLLKNATVSFPSARKIGQKELNVLHASEQEEVENYRFLRATSSFYLTSDNRRVVNPTGISSDKLSGLISYIYAKDSFLSEIERAFEDMGIELCFLPATLAQVEYLIPSETRDEGALFLDYGYLSSTACILLGNGILTQKSFWVGKGHLVFRIMNAFSMPYEAAISLLGKAGLYPKNSPAGEFVWKGTTYEISPEKLAEQIELGLDDLCEQVGAFFEESTGKELEYKPLYVSGEGIYGLRGGIEQMSKRLSRVCEERAPDLPYHNKPYESSRVSLVEMAQQDDKKRGFWYKLLNFGG